VGRRTIVSLLFVPLTLIATEIAHVFAGLGGSGHVDVRRWTDAVAPALALMLAAVVLASRERAGVRWFVVVPALVFAVQEHAERLVHGDAAAGVVALEPLFLLGVALQIPFGLLAYLLGRWALAIKGRIVRALARPALLLPAQPPLPGHGRDALPPRRPPLARWGASRAPPAFGF
jgi:hypothetical protein